MISIICCYNNQSVLDDFLIESLNMQELEYELILLDNTKNKYKSAAEALNVGLDCVKFENVCLAHQDISFSNSRFLNELVDYINEFEDDAIFGVAGVIENGTIYSNIKHGKNRKFVTTNRLIEPKKVQTIDELLIAGKSKTIKKVKFDEVTCNGWHLYVVDLCLSAARFGISCFVLPLDLYHKSKGSLSNEYYETAKKLAKKHRKYVKVIYTTCLQFPTSSLKFNTKILLMNIKKFI